MATAENLTVEALAQKAEQIRTRLGVDGEPSARTNELETGTVDQVCEKCGVSFQRPQVLIGGRDFAPKRVCDPCIDREKTQTARVSEAQSEFESRGAAIGRESAFRAILQDAGGNPWEHGHASLDNFDTGDAGPKPLGAAREFANAVKVANKYDPVRGLYLHGETGPGKTHLAVGVVRWLIENDYPASRIVFDHAAELIARIQDTYGKKDQSTFDVLERRFTSGLWILDDFGTERASDDVVRHLTLIFARRAMRPTLVTSNFSPAKLDKDRPELMRVLSRLGPAYFRTVEVKGRDRRFD